MSVRQPVLIALLLIAIGSAAGAAPFPGPADEPRTAAPANVPDRLQWFREAKFGLFIHWGAYAIVGREEWARQLLQIPREEYRDMALTFDPAGFDPDAWAALAKDAGAKYVVITSKHHDGFAIYDSAFSDFDIMSAKYGKDILGPLSASMNKGRDPARFLLFDHGLAPSRLPAPAALGDEADDEGRRFRPLHGLRRRTSSRNSSPSTIRPSSGSTASGSTPTRSSGPSPSGRC